MLLFERILERLAVDEQDGVEFVFESIEQIREEGIMHLWGISIKPLTKL